VTASCRRSLALIGRWHRNSRQEPYCRHRRTRWIRPCRCHRYSRASRRCPAWDTTNRLLRRNSRNSRRQSKHFRRRKPRPCRSSNSHTSWGQRRAYWARSRWTFARRLQILLRWLRCWTRWADPKSCWNSRSPKVQPHQVRLNTLPQGQRIDAWRFTILQEKVRVATAQAEQRPCTFYLDTPTAMNGSKSLCWR